MGRGCNPLHAALALTPFPHPWNSQERGRSRARKHRHTVRDGSVAVAAGHTSGATVGHWTRVGEGKMNQVAQHCLMISEGMGGANILHVSVIKLGIGWVFVCVCAWVHRDTATNHQAQV